MPRSTELYRKHRWTCSLPSDPEKIDMPVSPVFLEASEELDARIRKLVGKVTVPRDLRHGHCSIRRLLEQDDERSAARSRRKYFSTFDEPCSHHVLRNFTQGCSMRFFESRTVWNASKPARQNDTMRRLLPSRVIIVIWYWIIDSRWWSNKRNIFCT